MKGVLREDWFRQEIAVCLLGKVDPFVEAASEIALQFLCYQPQPCLEDASNGLIHLMLHSDQITIENLPLPYSKVSDHPHIDACILLSYLLQLYQFLALLEECLLKGLLWHYALDLYSCQMINCLLEVDFQHLQVLVNLNSTIVILKLHLLALLGCLVPLGEDPVHCVGLVLRLGEARVDGFEIKAVLQVFEEVLPKAFVDQVHPYFQKVDAKLGLQFNLIGLLH